MIKRVRFRFSGIVQGVGFRPFIYRIAQLHDLAGFVQNRPDGVVVEAEGPETSLEAFLSDVHHRLPPLADVRDLTAEDVPVQEKRGFAIIASDTQGAADLHISPDIATCSECLCEMSDPGDRRYRYPFINCTDCGPRLTIISGIPYDRVNTSMSCFPMCPECSKEYGDPEDRRFHAEPNGCPVCGPRLAFLDREGNQIQTGDPLKSACERLREGFIVAVKGLGGFHLCVDAENDEAVKRLRLRKFREEKPLAIMVRDIESASILACVDDSEKTLLESFQRPIVLLSKKDNRLISDGVAPGLANVGVMLPYTPLQRLFFENGFNALVMTSANQTDEPICIGNREAVSRLRGIADFFLAHNRDILVRCDDSVAMAVSGQPVLLRRSRGYVPKPLMLGESFPDVLAMGPHMKTTVCVVKGEVAFLSPHIGDLETPQARDFLAESVDLICEIAQCRPSQIACDLHPGYHTSREARKFEGVDQVIPVQHHHAHVVSCMADNQITGTVIGLAMDGTGYGSDGSIWGGEFLVADEAGFQRLGHLSGFQLPGGEKAIHEPWRIGASLLKESFENEWHDLAARMKLLPEEGFHTLMDAVMANQLNSPLTSSLGRLFDGVAAILGIRKKVSFEGQAAMELEAIARDQGGEALSFNVREEGGCFLLDFKPAVRKIAELFLAGRSRESLAWAFHHSLAAGFRDMTHLIRAKTGLNRAVLSGGCFQNHLLLSQCLRELGNDGLEVFFHRRVPTNDGGVSLGQAVSAGAVLKKIQRLGIEH